MSSRSLFCNFWSANENKRGHEKGIHAKPYAQDIKSRTSTVVEYYIKKLNLWGGVNTGKYNDNVRVCGEKKYQCDDNASRETREINSAILGKY
jgi:hypothetical protein